jgi:hypothetical protein
MENEIRQKIPMVFYTIWDDLPYPMYNREFYRSDDMHTLYLRKQTKHCKKCFKRFSKRRLGCKICSSWY